MASYSCSIRHFHLNKSTRYTRRSHMLVASCKVFDYVIYKKSFAYSSKDCAAFCRSLLALLNLSTYNPRSMAFLCFSKLSWYAILSTLVTFSVVQYAYLSRQQFFPTVSYLMTSKVCVLALINQTVLSVFLFGNLIQKIFLGKLSMREKEVCASFHLWCICALEKLSQLHSSLISIFLHKNGYFLHSFLFPAVLRSVYRLLLFFFRTCSVYTRP